MDFNHRYPSYADGALNTKLRRDKLGAEYGYRARNYSLEDYRVSINTYSAF